MEPAQPTTLISTCTSNSPPERLDLQSSRLPNFPEIFKQYEKHHEQIFNHGCSLANRSFVEIQQSMKKEYMKLQDKISGIGNEAVFKIILPLFEASGNLIRRACLEDEKFIFSRNRGSEFSLESPIDEKSLKLILGNGGHFYFQEKDIFILVMESIKDDEIIGYAVYSIKKGTNISALAEMECLEIKESKQENGLGTLLCETILLELSEKKIQEIQLIPTPKGAPLYVNIGFMPTDCKKAEVYDKWVKLEISKKIKECRNAYDIYLNLNNYNLEGVDDQNIISKIKKIYLDKIKAHPEQKSDLSYLLEYLDQHVLFDCRLLPLRILK